MPSLTITPRRAAPNQLSKRHAPSLFFTILGLGVRRDSVLLDGPRGHDTALSSSLYQGIEDRCHFIATYVPFM